MSTMPKPAATSINRSPRSPISSVPWTFSAQANTVFSLSTERITSAVYGLTATASTRSPICTVNQAGTSAFLGAT